MESTGIERLIFVCEQNQKPKSYPEKRMTETVGKIFAGKQNKIEIKYEDRIETTDTITRDSNY